MRQVIFDTETTGLDHRTHRVVSVAAIELLNGELTGAFAHWHLNPERPCDPGAAAIHGLTDEYLATQPKFAEIVGQFRDFLGLDELIIHNARFDVPFIQMEITRTLDPTKRWDPVTMFPRHRCTYEHAVRLRGMGKGRNTLDALTKAFGALDVRTLSGGKHGALIDCVQLYGVYRALNRLPQVPLVESLLQHYLTKGFGVHGRVECSGPGSPAIPSPPQADPTGQPADVCAVGG